MMLECSTGELLARAAFMHHDDQGHDALRHYAVSKELKDCMKISYFCEKPLRLAARVCEKAGCEYLSEQLCEK